MSNLNVDEIYSSGDFLAAADLQGRRQTVTISGARLEEFKEGEQRKIVLSFEGTDKCLVLNKTNGQMIKELLGSPDASTWIGKQITLRPDKTNYAGKLVDCIRVDAEAPAAAAPAGSVNTFTDKIPF